MSVSLIRVKQILYNFMVIHTWSHYGQICSTALPYSNVRHIRVDLVGQDFKKERDPPTLHGSVVKH